MSADAEGEVDSYSRLFSAVGNPTIVSKTSGFVFCPETSLVVEGLKQETKPEVLRSCQQSQRIDGLAVEQDLVVQVGISSAARRADEANHVAAFDGLARPHGKA
jgi:hypothetical protein